MLESLALGALSAGGSLLSGLGKSQSTAKQNRMQMIQDAEAFRINAENTAVTNARKEQLAREFMDIPEVRTLRTDRGGSDVQTSESSTRSYVDYRRMMADGEAAGFNPVTWLQHGAMQAYTATDTLGVNQQDYGSWDETTETRSGHNVAAALSFMVPETALKQATQVQRVPSMFEAFGDAITAGTNMFANQYNRQQSQDWNVENMMNRFNLSSMGGGGTNNSVSSGGRITSGGAASGNRSLTSTSTPGDLGEGQAYGLPGVGGKLEETDRDKWTEAQVQAMLSSGDGIPRTKWMPGDIKVSNPWPQVKNNPGFFGADAGVVEDYLGEWGGDIYGLGKAADLIWYNRYGQTLGGSYRDWRRPPQKSAPLRSENVYSPPYTSRGLFGPDTGPEFMSWRGLQ
ncbi:MAG: hypothetical protein [Microviridae sp.]|nr:MAG: hypothetical protein [Microviridae sp.]